MMTVPILEYSHYVMSEIPFILLTAAALLVGERALASRFPPTENREPGGDTAAARPQSGQRGLLFSLLPFFILAGSAFYTRTIGVTLLAAVLVVLLLRKKWIPFLGSLALLGLVLVPWIVHTITADPGGSTYLDQLLSASPYRPELGQIDAAALWQRIVANCRSYLLQDIPLALVPYVYLSSNTPLVHPSWAPPWALGVIFTPVIFVGMVRCMKLLPVTTAYVVAFLGVCILWPESWTSTRFILPCLPLLFLFMIVGLWSLLTAPAIRTLRHMPAACQADLPFGSRGTRWMMSLFIAALLVGCMRNAVILRQEVGTYPESWSAYFEAAAWAKENLAPESLVVDRKPQLFTISSGLLATAIPREPDLDRMLDTLNEHGVTHVHVATISYSELPQFLYPVVGQRRSYFRHVWHKEEGPQRQFLGGLFEFCPAGIEE